MHEQAEPLKGFGSAGVLEKGTGKVFDGAES